MGVSALAPRVCPQKAGYETAVRFRLASRSHALPRGREGKASQAREAMYTEVTSYEPVLFLSGVGALVLDSGRACAGSDGLSPDQTRHGRVTGVRRGVVL